MKKITAKCVKGESTVFVSFFGVNREGRITSDQKQTYMYGVSLGGSFGFRNYNSKLMADAAFCGRVGELVKRGYSASKVEE